MNRTRNNGPMRHTLMFMLIAKKSAVRSARGAIRAEVHPPFPALAALLPFVSTLACVGGAKDGVFWG